MDLNLFRREYDRESLVEKEIDPNPFRQFHKWLQAAIGMGIEDATAMALSTVGSDGSPSTRMVLLKELDSRGFVFFTNYQSRKGMEMKINNRASLLFYWKELDRQVRVTGISGKITRKESETYFRSRSLESRISAVISPQSQRIPDRDWLESRWLEYKNIHTNTQPDCPYSWGGYRVRPLEFEFFHGRPYRLHDRIRYLRQGKRWSIDRLAP